ncbi:MAG: hypothetical protein WCA77_02535 [Thermoplasmata archaeon]
MDAYIDSSLAALFGSRTRLLTMAVLANADEALTGYRIALIAGLPRVKVYPELRKGLATKLLAKERAGYRMIDPDIRALLRRRIRIRWSDEWDRARKNWNAETPNRLVELLKSIPESPDYLRPKGWKPSPAARRAIREMERPVSKNKLLRRRGLRTSLRDDWTLER